MPITLTAHNFRGLRNVRWTIPDGVSALVGPNGCGKSTLLRVPLLLRTALEHGIGAAAGMVGGPTYLRHFDVRSDEDTTVGVVVDDMAWTLRVLTTPTTIDCEDRLERAGEPLLHREPFAGTTAFRGRAPFAIPQGGPALRVALASNVEGVEQADPVVQALRRWRVYEQQEYQLGQVRLAMAHGASDAHLNAWGGNGLPMLRGWRDARATKARWEFVLGTLREMFPDLFEDIEFVTTQDGRLLASFVRPGREEAIPQHLAPNGWIVALLHLSALATIEERAVVAIDEVENGLHPYAIRRFIDAVDAWARARGASVVFATHSPVVLNHFKEAPERLFVMQPGSDPLPVALDALRDRAWLQHFELGDLFAHMEFGAPVTS